VKSSYRNCFPLRPEPMELEGAGAGADAGADAGAGAGADAGAGAGAGSCTGVVGAGVGVLGAGAGVLGAGAEGWATGGGTVPVPGVTACGAPVPTVTTAFPAVEPDDRVIVATPSFRPWIVPDIPAIDATVVSLDDHTPRAPSALEISSPCSSLKTGLSLIDSPTAMVVDVGDSAMLAGATARDPAAVRSVTSGPILLTSAAEQAATPRSMAESVADL